MTEFQGYHQHQTEIISHAYQQGDEMRTIQPLIPEIEMRTVQQLLPEIEYVQMQFQVPEIEYVPIKVLNQQYIPEPRPERRQRFVLREKKERAQTPPEKVVKYYLFQGATGVICLSEHR